MTLIEIGGYAGALMAVFSLVQKMISLLSASQKILHQIETLQIDLSQTQADTAALSDQLRQQAYRIDTIEGYLSPVNGQLTDISNTLKEMSQHVLK
ncbi:hypothetical protein [Facklamia lactis]|uniref:hypothetical protein n=1 Tax=Facklamia lactis TaxID=2749967 RepID=UPI0018CEF4AF|nr:hypothetical protein [Facklamia lactis]MBG9981041.1 hypothetical protein [Facklamia lactis]